MRFRTWITRITGLAALLMATVGYAGPLHDSVKAGDLERVSEAHPDPRGTSTRRTRSAGPRYSGPRARNNVEIAKVLIAEGADVNVGALHTAAYKGNAEMVDLLIVYGADVNYRNPRGVFASPRGGESR